MAPTTPYSPDLEGADPIAAMRDTAAEVARLVASWSADDFERAYAPGKWTAREIFVHLVHAELALGTRARMALTTPHYVAQPFDQDKWMDVEAMTSGSAAAGAFVTLAAFNAAFYASLSDEQRQTALGHPEYGTLTVDWILYQQAGHQRHHLKQLTQME